MLAEALHAGGLGVASELVAVNAEVNARGFWEDKFVVDLNERIFAALESAWYDIRELPEGWENSAALEQMRNEASLYLKDQYGGAISVIKDPRLSRLLPFWLPLFAAAGIELNLVLMLRNPVAVARSLLKRDGLPLNYGLLLCIRYMSDAFKYCGSHSSLTFEYDQLLANPSENLASLCDEFGLPVATDHSGVLAVFDSALRHQDGTPDSTVTAEFADAALGIYGALLSRSTEPVDFPLPSSSCESLYQIAQSLVLTRGELMQLGAEHQTALSTLQRRDGQLTESNRQLEEAGKALEAAQSTVAQRDQQLQQANSDVAKQGQLLAKAEATVRERDAQLQQVNEDVDRQGQLLAHAEDIVKLRDTELARLQSEMETLRAAHESLYENLRGTILGKLALKWIERGKQSDQD